MRLVVLGGGERRYGYSGKGYDVFVSDLEK
jgi:hypothetical protein